MDVEQCKREIQAWLDEEEIVNARKDDAHILHFLHGCKFNMDVVKHKLRNYYQLRHSASEWFDNRDPMLSGMQVLLKLGVFLPLPEPDDAGRRVVLVRATVNNPRLNPMSEVFKLGIMVVDLAIELDDAITHNGVAVVIDLQGVGMLHGLQMTSSLIRRAVYSWQDCYPVRIKSIDFINCPSYVAVILNLFKQFMTDKLRRRVKVHWRDSTNLHKIISPKILPKEYGGSAGPISEVIVNWKNKIESRREWFLNDLTIKK